MFGERLRLARKKAGLSLRDLSARLEGANRVSAQALGKYERGEMMPSSSVLLALMKALGEPLRFFMSPMGTALVDVDFRKKAGTSVRDRARITAAVLDHVERYLVVEEILGLESANWDVPFEPVNLSSVDEGEGLVDRVRKSWMLGGDPIPDMTELLEKNGVKVFAIDLPGSVSGLTCLVERSLNRPPVPVIVVNATHNIERRRMTLAHELAHRLIDPESPADEEKAAMRFAGAFLMPAAHLEGEVGRRRCSLGYLELMELKHIYRVGAAAALVRFEQIGIINHSTMVRIFQTIGSGWRKNEPLPIEDATAERASRFGRLCFRALSERLISPAKAIDLLGVTADEIQQELKGPKSGANHRQ
ncbi:helix-turn-helix domain-containing protein [Thioalkalivibrio sp. HK1]|uniref:helix-turn-helix domain-containing protein n=1 Tax=Thioalkalivibrio sp. HK1 TaxID=1469245 RepID=UPI00046E6B2F|nr:XRE family transcriptional regulator [Thioalkalivibrio sp. HK1]